MFKLTISNMQNSDSRSFEFNDFKTAMSRFNEHMDANNINEIDFFDDAFDMWFADPTAVGEYLVAGCGGIGHDVRIELEAIKAFTPVHANSISNLPIIESKLRQLGARHIGRNDDEQMDLWQFENRMFIIRETWSSIDGERFEVYCSMEFNTLDSAIRQIENICRIQTFMA
jgi:hypothetical protein